MDFQDTDSSILNDAELSATLGGRDLVAADDPAFIPATGPMDKPRDPNRPLTPEQLRLLNRWKARIR